MSSIDLPFIAILLTLAMAIIAIAYQYGRIVVAQRNLAMMRREVHREREATADILRISGAAMRTEAAESDETTFLTYFVEYVARAVQGTGAAVFKLVEEEKLAGVAVAGVFPPLRDVPPQVEQKLLGSCKYHTEYIKSIPPFLSVADVKAELGERPYRLYASDAPPWLPPRFKSLAPKLLLAPILRGKKVEGCVLVVSRNEFDEHALGEDDGAHIVRLNELATLSLDAIRIFRRRQQYEEELQVAREEGMLQVSTGIIHNIGNAITVAKLAIHEILEKQGSDEDRPEKLIRGLILPRMRDELAKGSIDSFLRSDKVGSQYLDIIDELLLSLEKSDAERLAIIKGLNEKLHHISEIVELQQRFMGELGTENLTSLAEPIQSAIKIYRETCDKRGIQMEVSIQEHTPPVLIDSSMIAQVFVNLMKNAAEAMETVRERAPRLRIELKTLPGDFPGKTLVSASVSDNGPGIPDDVLPRIFDFGFSTKSAGSRGFGLHSCRKTIEKYGGEIKVETKLGEGTTFTVLLAASHDTQHG